MKLRLVHRHENGPAWKCPGRPAVAAHRALAGFRGGSGRARQTGRSHAGWRARRMAGNHRRPSGPGIATGSLLHGVVTSLGWDFCGMGSLQPRLGSPRFVVTCSFRENHRSIARVRPQRSDFALPISSTPRTGQSGLDTERRDQARPAPPSASVDDASAPRRRPICTSRRLNR